MTSISEITKRLSQKLKKLSLLNSQSNKSIAINNNKIIENFRANPQNSFLISFPRTGSHWLRMMMELYFERPSLVRVFYFPTQKNYLTLHTHDLDLKTERSNIIYLYRNPNDTIYSQLSYYKEDLNNIRKIIYWANLYGQHLDKWLFKENFTKKKAIITYEGLKKDIVTEFSKIAEHFNYPLDKKKLTLVSNKIKKKEVQKKTKHDKQVINLNKQYQINKLVFITKYQNLITDTILKDRPHLINITQ